MGESTEVPFLTHSVYRHLHVAFNGMQLWFDLLETLSFDDVTLLADDAP
jgi:hypothetical protein